MVGFSLVVAVASTLSTAPPDMKLSRTMHAGRPTARFARGVAVVAGCVALCGAALAADAGHAFEWLDAGRDASVRYENQVVIAQSRGVADDGARAELALPAAANRMDVGGLGRLMLLDQSEDVRRPGNEISAAPSLLSGLSYAEHEFKAARWRDFEHREAPVSLYYAVAPPVAVALEYRLARERFSGMEARASDRHFLGVNAGAEFSDAFSSELRVGLLQREEGFNDEENILGFDASLRWSAAPRLAFLVTLSRDLRASRATDEVGAGTAVGLRAEYAISEVWSATTTASYNVVSYSAPRRDELVCLELFLNYTSSSHVTMSAGYIFEDNRSHLAAADYTDGQVRVSAALRY